MQYMVMSVHDWQGPILEEEECNVSLREIG